jgi:hypothetical protein
MRDNSWSKLCILVCIGCLVFLDCTPYSLKGRTHADEEYLAAARQFPLEFNVSKNEEYNTWGRAQSYVGRYSKMRIQVVSDFVIHTYNPTDLNYGYYIVKTPTEDSMQISVQCVPGEYASVDIANDLAHICAYYVKTGNLPPVGLVQVRKEEKPGLPIPLWSVFLGLGIISVVVYIAIHSTVY